MSDREMQPASGGALEKRVSRALSRRIPDSGSSVAGMLGAPASDADKPWDALQTAHRALRGRYWLAFVLCLAGAAAGAWFGHRFQEPLYRSEGLLKVAYQRPEVMKETDQNRPMAMFEAVMRSQQIVIGSRRMVGKALQTVEWKSTGRGDSPSMIEEFAQQLTVEHPAGTEYLRIIYEDQDPIVAAAAVNSVIAAFSQAATRSDNEFENRRLDLLNALRNTQAEELGKYRKELADVILKYGSADLGPRCDAMQAQMIDCERKLNELRLAMALTQQQSPERSEDGEVRVLDARQIASFDPVMRNYLLEREQIEERLERLRGRYGAAHREMIDTQKALDIVQSRIDRYAAEYTAYQQSLAQSPQTAVRGPAGLTTISAEDLRAQMTVISKMRDEAERELLALGKEKQRTDSVKLEAEKLKHELETITERIATLQLESSLGSRLTVVSPGEVPIDPYVDRRMKFAAAGGVGGVAIPLGLLLLAGLANRRYRYSDEAGDALGGIPLLGIVPTLPNRLSDPEVVADAAQCVHQIRVMLQGGRPPGSSTVYLITSSSPGQGKTSLTTALGLSYVAAGCRTLVIDCDLVGRRLTHGFRAQREPGLHEALADGRLREYVRECSTGLSYLSVGKGGTPAAWTVSSAAVRKLLEEARQRFDVVLVDTGPVLCSVEASVVAPEVDGVIFAIARGEQRPAVEKAIKHLESIGARLVGMVFNRAQTRDFYHSGYGYGYGYSRRPDRGSGATLRPRTPDVAEMAGFGPLVRSVASFMPASAEVKQEP